MGLLADRLGVKTPALYNHVTGQAHLVHRIAILATTELADAIREATQGGRAGTPSPLARRRCGCMCGSTPAGTRRATLPA